MFAKAVLFRNAVVIEFTRKGKHLRLATGITRVRPEQLTGNQLSPDVKDHERKNRIIQTLLLQVNRIIDDYFTAYKEKPPVDYVRSMIEKPVQRVTIGEEQRIIENSGSFHKICLEFYESKKQDAIVKASLKDYLSTFNMLEAYHKLKHRISLDMVNSPDFLKSFERFCSDPIPEDKQQELLVRGCLNSNTVRKRISVIKTFLKWCLEKKYVQENRIAGYATKIRSFQPTVVILSRQEQKQLEARNLSGQDEQLRDILLLLCRTGMRYSDLLTLSRDDVINGYITKAAEKTRLRFKVPISPKSMKLLKKYNYNFNIFPTTMYNRLIKKLLKRQEICNYSITVRDIKYTDIERSQVMKYEEISSHTGRRTFIGHCIMAGIPIPEIMSFTGHRKMSSLQVYVDLFQIQKDSKRKIRALD